MDREEVRLRVYAAVHDSADIEAQTDAIMEMATTPKSRDGIHEALSVVAVVMCIFVVFTGLVWAVMSVGSSWNTTSTPIPCVGKCAAHDALVGSVVEIQNAAHASDNSYDSVPFIAVSRMATREKVVAQRLGDKACAAFLGDVIVAAKAKDGPSVIISADDAESDCRT